MSIRFNNSFEANRKEAEYNSDKERLFNLLLNAKKNETDIFNRQELVMRVQNKYHDINLIFRAFDELVENGQIIKITTTRAKGKKEINLADASYRLS